MRTRYALGLLLVAAVTASLVEECGGSSRGVSFLQRQRQYNIMDPSQNEQEEEAEKGIDDINYGNGNSEKCSNHSDHHHDGKIVVDGGVWGCRYAREEAEEAAEKEEAAASAPAPAPDAAAPAPVTGHRHSEKSREIELPEPEPELQDMGVWGCHYSSPVKRGENLGLHPCYCDHTH